MSAIGLSLTPPTHHVFAARCLLPASVRQWPADGGDLQAGAAPEWAAGVLLWRPGGRAQLRGAHHLCDLQRILHLIIQAESNTVHDPNLYIRCRFKENFRLLCFDTETLQAAHLLWLVQS